MNKHLLTYGSLMFEEIWGQLIESSYQKQRAYLPNFQRYKIKDKQYPALIEQTGEGCYGLLYKNISPMDLVKLDEFEGCQYQRQTKHVYLDSGLRVPAEVYILFPSYFDVLEKEVWFPNDFNRYQSVDLL